MPLTSIHHALNNYIQILDHDSTIKKVWEKTIAERGFDIEVRENGGE